MRFTELTLDEFKQHTSENKSHFTQMVENYQMKVETGKETYLVGVKNDSGEVLASCLVTLSPLMRVMRYAYTNRGPVMDYSNEGLVKFFFAELEKFLKPRKVVSLRVDPYEVLNVWNHDGEILEDKDQTHLFNTFQDMGYSHTGYPTGFDIRHQIRWLSVLNVEGKDEKTLLNDMDSLRKRNIKKALKNGMRMRFLELDELNIFRDFMNQTSEMKDFFDRDDTFYYERKKYYKDKVLVPLVYIELDEYNSVNEKDLKKLEADLAKAHKELEKDNVNVEKVQRKIENFEVQVKNKRENYEEGLRLKETHGDTLNLASGFYFVNDHEVVYLSGGTANEYRHFAGSYLMQWEMIKYTLEHNLPIYNFYGITGVFTEDAEDYGVLQFKKGFNAVVNEYVGDFIKPLNKPMNTLHETIQKIKNR
ncbi:aminoacyltransferase [Aliicoccus persicus]|uniref:Peptidoglycan pentaglycine glycine transferase (The second and third glycine) n=1 Tax=Aliicoccus persicus TaxID=930138 RepID=A0A662Z0Y0_9STAP|nr:aminoacyltransferase [Aliicoccus persicus]SEV82829.1 peptidoglycan pentaglycine glycine transferase (the second and third glycine) [Aliicoccus persicus]